MTRYTCTKGATKYNTWERQTIALSITTLLKPNIEQTHEQNLDPKTGELDILVE